MGPVFCPSTRTGFYAKSGLLVIMIPTVLHPLIICTRCSKKVVSVEEPRSLAIIRFWRQDSWTTHMVLSLNLRNLEKSFARRKNCAAEVGKKWKIRTSARKKSRFMSRRGAESGEKLWRLPEA